MHTIFALATARGKSGVAVIRISGPDAFAIGRVLLKTLPEPGSFGLRSLYNMQAQLIDEPLVLVFEAPKSFTGEDVLELQLHGSTAIISAAEQAIAETGLGQPAEPGEFTRRALMNGRMDLAQVEGLGDLIEAETELQRQQAQALVSGALRDFADRVRSKLLRAVALIEATIDFADEEVPTDVSAEVEALLGEVQDDIHRELAGMDVSERLRGGFEVAIMGAPNVGKSTLLNRIAGRDIAITSEIAGTTRDVIEVKADLFGLPVTFLDTAGLRETGDAVEKIGVGRALERAKGADIRILLTTPEVRGVEVGDVQPDLIYSNMSDRYGGGISGLTGDGVDALLGEVHRLLSERVARKSTASHGRHRIVLEMAVSCLGTASKMLADGAAGDELIAAELRRATSTLDSLIGRTDVEAVLGEIFSAFCIGK